MAVWYLVLSVLQSGKNFHKVNDTYFSFFVDNFLEVYICLCSHRENFIIVSNEFSNYFSHGNFKEYAYNCVLVTSYLALG